MPYFKVSVVFVATSQFRCSGSLLLDNKLSLNLVAENNDYFILLMIFWVKNLGRAQLDGWFIPDPVVSAGIVVGETTSKMPSSLTCLMPQYSLASL